MNKGVVENVDEDGAEGVPDVLLQFVNHLQPVLVEELIYRLTWKKEPDTCRPRSPRRPRTGYLPNTLFPLKRLLKWSLIPDTLKSTFMLVIWMISLPWSSLYSNFVVTRHFPSPEKPIH